MKEKNDLKRLVIAFLMAIVFIALITAFVLCINFLLSMADWMLYVLIGGGSFLALTYVIYNWLKDNEQ